MEVAPFGSITPDRLEEYYHAEMLVNGSLVEVDMNFESESTDETTLELINTFISQMDAMSSKAFRAISDDYDLGEESETARFYLQHHLDQFSQEELLSVFGTETVDKDAFMKALSLQRVGFYPENKDAIIMFDIQLSEEHTNYLMAVTFDEHGDLALISMDS